ncbi:MAG: hypothetical protein GXO27_03840 [Chlorobi bacterium]|nr:hypothetical protein [Chlorobiota bacterium]
MKRLILWMLASMLAAGCGGPKKLRARLAAGEYDRVIEVAVTKIRHGAKKKGEYIRLLEEAYARATDRDLQEIRRLEKESDPAKWKEIYRLYARIMDRQDKVRPLLPLKVAGENRYARFDMTDYTPRLRQARDRMVEYTYRQARSLMERAGDDRGKYREAYGLLEEVVRMSPGYRDAEALMAEARRKGTVRVGVAVVNETNKPLPLSVTRILTDFTRLNGQVFWNRFEPARPGGAYDYNVWVRVTDVWVSPPREDKETVRRERQVNDKTGYVRDQRGQVVKDSTGRPVQQEKLRTVRATVHKYRRYREARMTALAEIRKAGGGTPKVHPLSGKGVFENIYLVVEGDERALDDELARYRKNRRLPFPSEAEMTARAAADLKTELDRLLAQTPFE